MKNRPATNHVPATPRRSARDRPVLFAAFLGVILLAVPAGAQLAPIGSEFQVNSYTTYSQEDPWLAMHDDGSFVVVWKSGEIAWPDPVDDKDVFAQRFDSAGVPVGDEFCVNVNTNGHQQWARAGTTPDGGFVVVWDDYPSGGVTLRRFSSNGTPLSGELLANTLTANWTRPDIAVDGVGGSIVTWHSLGSLGSDSDNLSVQARLYDSAGLASGSQFQINTFTTGYQGQAAVAAAPTGEFVVVWTQKALGLHEIRGRIFTSNGSPLSGELMVNSLTTGRRLEPHVSMFEDGGFVVAWSEYEQTKTDPSYGSVRARRIDSTGAFVGDEFQVNSYTPGVEVIPRTAALAGGAFIVTWTSFDGLGSEPSIVQARLFNSNGTPNGGDLQVSCATSQWQRIASLGATPDKRHMAIAWTNEEIVAQLFNIAIFTDGFEGGDLTVWSTTVSP